MRKLSFKLLFLILFSFFLTVGVAELSFRLLLPETFLLDWDSPEYWKARLAGKLKKDMNHGSISLADTGKNIIYDRDLGWRMKPEYENELVRHNSKGFRSNKEYNSYTDRQRVLVLGDSYTYGLGVSDEYTYSSLIDRTSELEVINAGVNGYGIDQAYLLWEIEGKKLNPSIVILGYFIDDFYRNTYPIRGKPKPYFVYDEDVESYVLAGVPVPDNKTVLERGDLDVDRWLKVFRIFPWIRSGIQKKLGFEEIPNYKALLEKARLNEYILKQLNNSVKESGAELVIVFIGAHPKCYEPSPEIEWIEESVIEFCLNNGIDIINLADMMRKSEFYSSFYALNCHFSERGHRFAAEKIIEELDLAN